MVHPVREFTQSLIFGDSQGVVIENTTAIYEGNDSVGVDRKMSKFDKTRSGEFGRSFTAFLREGTYAETIEPCHSKNDEGWRIDARGDGRKIKR